PYFQAVQRLESQMYTFHRLRMGDLSVVPPKEGDTWVPIRALEGDLQTKFVRLSEAFIKTLAAEGGKTLPSGEEAPDFQKSFESFVLAARAENPDLYPKESDMMREVHFNELHPFQY